MKTSILSLFIVLGLNGLANALPQPVETYPSFVVRDSHGPAEPEELLEDQMHTNGRSGYNRVEVRGRSGYHRVGEAGAEGGAKTEDRSGYDQIGKVEADGRSGYNRVGVKGRSGYNSIEADTMGTEGRSGYNRA
ncbi:hypothetical protein PG999_004519 [Apiospora kogelbergensis]|uniref:Uncharacterized protein n=1 Tax=Apiospora kogelbergensis TaxID=1337665 RepID=A0AAW0QZM5_9PEZI